MSNIHSRIGGARAQLAVKAPCRAATIANVTLSGEQQIDGVDLEEGDRILVKDQTLPEENGVYVVSPRAWTRATDFDGTDDATTGTLVVVSSGDTAYGVWQVTTEMPFVIGEDEIAFQKTFGGAMLSGNNLSDVGDPSTSLTNLGVSAYAKTLLDDTSASAALTTLGVSTFAKTLIDDASAAAARATLGVTGVALSVTDTQFGAVGDGSDNTTAFNACAAYANANGGNVTFVIPDGQYSLPNGVTTAITVSNVYFIGASMGGAILLCGASYVFRFGDGSSAQITGGGVANVTFKYASAPSSAYCFRVELATRLAFWNIQLDNAGSLAYLGESGRIASSLAFSNIYGKVNNAGQSLFWLRYGAGLYLHQLQVYVGGVDPPAHGASMTSAAGQYVISCPTGSWDTVIASDCLFERWYAGLVVAASTGMTYINMFFHNCVFDYCRKWVYYLNTSGGGTCCFVEHTGGHISSWEDHAIQISSGGYQEGHAFHGFKVDFAGKSALYYAATSARDVIASHLRIAGTNQAGGGEASVTIAANSRGITLVDSAINYDVSLSGVTWRSPYAIDVGGDPQDILIARNRVSGSTGGITYASNASSLDTRVIVDNIGQTNVVEGSVASGSAVSLTTTVASNITSISLEPGDWDLAGCVLFSGGGTTTLTALQASMSATSATIDVAAGRYDAVPFNGTSTGLAFVPTLSMGPTRVRLLATTTYYLVAKATFGTSTCSAYGYIKAKRIA